MNPSSGKWRIRCQHGAPECALNIMHACILDIVPFDSAIQLIACAMKIFGTPLEEVSINLKD